MPHRVPSIYASQKQLSSLTKQLYDRIEAATHYRRRFRRRQHFLLNIHQRKLRLKRWIYLDYTPHNNHDIRQPDPIFFSINGLDFRLSSQKVLIFNLFLFFRISPTPFFSLS